MPHEPLDEVELAGQLATLTVSLANVESMVRELRDSVLRQQDQQDLRIGANTDGVQALRLEFAEHCGQVKVDEVRQQSQTEREGRIKDTLDDHEERIKQLERLAPAMRVVIWIGGALGVSVVALIWALITGQAVVVFP